MGGIDNINHQCQKEAYESNTAGIFRAFLSSKEIDLPRLVKGKSDVIVNLKNETLYSSWKKIFDPASTIGPVIVENGTRQYLYSFDGRDVMMDEHWYEKS